MCLSIAVGSGALVQQVEVEERFIDQLDTMAGNIAGLFTNNAVDLRHPSYIAVIDDCPAVVLINDTIVATVVINSLLLVVKMHLKITLQVFIVGILVLQGEVITNCIFPGELHQAGKFVRVAFKVGHEFIKLFIIRQ